MSDFLQPSAGFSYPLDKSLSGTSNSMRQKGLEWKYVEVLEKDSTSSHARIRCLHCAKEFKGGASRIRDHFLGNSPDVSSCPNIPEDVKEEFRRIQAEKLEARGKKRELGEIAPYPRRRAAKSLGAPLASSSQALVVRPANTPPAHVAVARFFFNKGLPFELVLDPHFQEMVKALTQAGPHYELPSYDELREIFLREKEILQQQMDKVMGETRMNAGMVEDRGLPRLEAPPAPAPQ